MNKEDIKKASGLVYRLDKLAESKKADLELDFIFPVGSSREAAKLQEDAYTKAHVLIRNAVIEAADIEIAVINKELKQMGVKL